MRKFLLLVIFLFFVFVLMCCDYNKPLREEMLSYYEQDANYEVMNGKIKSLYYIEEQDELFLQIDVLSDNQVSYNQSKSYCDFVLVNWSYYEIELKVDDEIMFTSASTYFYNGHVLPIIHIELNQVQLLSFAEGKENYIDWIKKKFD